MSKHLIHHITHVRNLPGILAEGGIWCDRESFDKALCRQSIGYADIKGRRGKRPVQRLFGQSIAAGGMVSDYVPFYFCNRSPMLGAISQGKVPSFDGGEEEVVYLVSTAERIAMTDLVWCFTDGHAAEPMTDFFDDLKDLDQVDWKAVETWKWGGRWRLNDPDITRRKQAEFLVHEYFPLSEVLGFAVMTIAMSERVSNLLMEAGSPFERKIKILPEWYYNSQ